MCLIALACRTKTDDAKWVIPKAKMGAVIYDMMLADRYSMQFMMNDSLKKNNMKWESMKLFNQVLAFHNVKKKDFFKSFDYYMSKPEELKVMFDSLVSRSNKMKESLYKTNMH
jgi:hypothetical protein